MAALPSFPEDAAQHILALAISAQPTGADALLGGQILRSRILQRTARGEDAAGSGFAPYSERYRQQKIAKLGHSDTVDLFGADHHIHMLNTILVKVNDSESMGAQQARNLQVGFYGEEATRARAHNDGAEIRSRSGGGKGKAKKGSSESFGMPRRHFFDANDEDIRLMEMAIGQSIEARMGNR